MMIREFNCPIQARGVPSPLFFISAAMSSGGMRAVDQAVDECIIVGD